MLSKKKWLIWIGCIVSNVIVAQIYIAKKCDISFSAPTPIEDIAAVNTATKPLLNKATGDFQMKIPMTAFVFEKPLMQEHFNENYVESEKFPYAYFKGKINDKIDYTKDGEYKTTATGKLTIHGVEKDRIIDGVVIIKNGEISISSSFKVIFEDHGIVIPSLYSGVIPPDASVKFYAQMEQFKKN